MWPDPVSMGLGSYHCQAGYPCVHKFIHLLTKCMLNTPSARQCGRHKGSKENSFPIILELRLVGGG
jgi:hypothetical protein